MTDENFDPTRIDTPIESSNTTDTQEPAATEVVQSVPNAPVPSAEAVTSPPERSTAQMAEQSRKELRRARDAHAESVAMRVLLFVFLGVGGLGLVLINAGIIDIGGPISQPAPGEAGSPQPSPPVLTAAPVESSKIPALQSLEREGLTIVAEGLPEVIAIDPLAPPGILVGIESCRYTFAIWEFSPNKRFRFMTTCELMKGEILAGAWHRDGSNILMSPLISAASSMKSRFEVEKPSRMITEIKITAPNAKPVQLLVKQRITGMRPGMDGASFLTAYEPRNTIKVKGIRIVPETPKTAPAPAPAPKKKSTGNPLLDLLE